MTAEQANAFMAKLFDPLPDAELADPEMAKLERCAKRGARDRIADQWCREVVLVELAERKMITARAEARLGDRRGGLVNLLALAAAESAARKTYHEACARAVLLPAPTATQLKWKLRTYAFKYQATPEMLAAVAADKERLGIQGQES